jgi:hypothetical protein
MSEADDVVLRFYPTGLRCVGCGTQEIEAVLNRAGTHATFSCSMACGGGRVAAAAAKEVAAPTWSVRDGHLFTESADGVFHSIGNDFYLFETGGEPWQLIRHERRAWLTNSRDLTCAERDAWMARRMLDYRDVKFSTGWQEKRW